MPVALPGRKVMGKRSWERREKNEICLLFDVAKVFFFGGGTTKNDQKKRQEEEISQQEPNYI